MMMSLPLGPERGVGRSLLAVLPSGHDRAACTELPRARLGHVTVKRVYKLDPFLLDLLKQRSLKIIACLPG